MRGLPALLAAVVTLAGCASDRAFQSTMTLAPGQSASGLFEIPGGGSGWVQFQRQAPVKGVEPYPEAWAWTGDGKILISFVDEPRLPAECALGYASSTLKDGRPCRVVLRNADAGPASFDWAVKGAPDVIAKWDFSGTASPR